MASEDRTVITSLPAAGQKPEGAGDLNKKAVPLIHQVAGHKHGVDKVGILQECDGTVLKQLQPPPRGQCEMQFYTQVFSADCTDPQLLALQQHLPKYYGTWTSSEKPNALYLKLEDVTSKFTCPCIMDVKIGRKTYDPLASQKKQEEQIRKYQLMEEIGFLILGMRVFQVSSKSYISFDRLYGRSLTKETLRTGLARFFHNGDKLRKDAISLSIRKIRNILCWFESQKQLHFFASSLLIVYEGSFSLANSNIQSVVQSENSDLISNSTPKLQEVNNSFSSQTNGRWEVNNSEPVKDSQHVGQVNRIRPHSLQEVVEQANEEQGEIVQEKIKVDKGKCSGFQNAKGNEKEVVDVRMIDFTHVFPSDSPDEGYIYGLRSLLSVLEQILLD